MSRRVSILLVVLVALALQVGFASNTVALRMKYEVEHIPKNQYMAHYFSEINDKVYTQVVDEVSINYSWSTFHAIPSKEFGAYWVGNFDFKDDDYLFQIDENWSDYTIYLDGNDISAGLGHEFTRKISEGEHVVEVYFLNNWHNTDFSVNIERVTHEFNLAMAKSILESEPSEYEVIDVAVSEPKDGSRDVIVNIGEYDSPIVLFLRSHQSVKWDIKNPHNIDISKIFYGSYQKGSTLNNSDLYEGRALRLSDSNYSKSGYDEGDITRFVDQYYEAYTSGEFDLLPPVKTSSTSSSSGIVNFSDFPRSNNNNDDIYQLIDYGVIKGADNKFRPNDAMTRAELAALLVQTLKLKPVKSDLEFFKDVSLDHWAYESITTIYQYGLIDGVAKRMYDPEGSVTLPQITKIMIDYLGYKNEATDLGGYPKGYESLNIGIGLSSPDVYNYNTPSTREAICRVISNSLDKTYNDYHKKDHVTLRDFYDNKGRRDTKTYNENLLISMKDKTFEKLIRDELKLVGPIKWRDLHDVKALKLESDYEKPVKDLSDLQWFTSLEEFRLLVKLEDEDDEKEGKSKSDESPKAVIKSFELGLPDFSKLQALTAFEYDHTSAVMDLERFAPLEKITELLIGDSKQVGDVSAFKDMKALVKLSFSGDISGNIDTFKDYTKMTDLAIGSTIMVGNVETLAGLKELLSLRVDTNYVTGDLIFLKELTALKSLEIVSDTIKCEMEKVAGLIKLSNLKINSANASGSVSVLFDLNKLRTVDLSGSDFTGNIFVFLDCSYLESLIIKETNVTGDLSSFRKLKYLESLVVADSKVYNSFQLSNGDIVKGPGVNDNIMDAAKTYSPETVIRFADAEFEKAIRVQNKLTDSVILWSDIIDIEKISLKNYNVKSINDVVWFKNLREFEAHRDWTANLNSSFSIFEDLKDLQVLDVSGSYMRGDLESLKAHNNLRILNVSGTNIVGSLTDIGHASSLQVLNFDSNSYIEGKLSDLSRLSRLKVLRTNDRVLGDLSDVANMHYLEELDLSPHLAVGNLETGISYVPMGITGELANLSQLKRLRVLIVQSENITGNLKDLAGKNDLEQLWLYGISIDGNLSSLSRYYRLKDISLESEEFSGEVSSLSNLRVLEKLELKSKNFGGHVSSLSHLSNLQVVVIMSDIIKGSKTDIPSVDSVEIRSYTK